MYVHIHMCIHNIILTTYVEEYHTVGNFHGSKILRNAPWPNIRGSY